VSFEFKTEIYLLINVMILLLSEFTVRLTCNAWTEYDEQYRAGLRQAGAVFI